MSTASSRATFAFTLGDGERQRKSLTEARRPCAEDAVDRIGRRLGGAELRRLGRAFVDLRAWSGRLVFGEARRVERVASHGDPARGQNVIPELGTDERGGAIRVPIATERLRAVLHAVCCRDLTAQEDETVLHALLGA